MQGMNNNGLAVGIGKYIVRGYTVVYVERLWNFQIVYPERARCAGRHGLDPHLQVLQIFLGTQFVHGLFGAPVEQLRGGVGC